jgi:hypothetical protein
MMYWKTYRMDWDDWTLFAFIVDSIFFTHKVFCIFDPLFFPILLPEVLKFDTWVKYWKYIEVSAATKKKEKLEIY